MELIWNNSALCLDEYKKKYYIEFERDTEDSVCLRKLNIESDFNFDIVDEINFCDSFMIPFEPGYSLCFDDISCLRTRLERGYLSEKYDPALVDYAMELGESRIYTFGSCEGQKKHERRAYLEFAVERIYYDIVLEAISNAMEQRVLSKFTIERKWDEEWSPMDPIFIDRFTIFPVPEYPRSEGDYSHLSNVTDEIIKGMRELDERIRIIKGKDKIREKLKAFLMPHELMEIEKEKEIIPTFDEIIYVNGLRRWELE
jgi:hypothetical protein